MAAEKKTFVVPNRARRRRDWERILLDLRSAGCSFSELGRICNRDVGTVRLWMAGGDPKDADARIVLALYQRYCPEKFEAHQREFGIVELEVKVVTRGEYAALARAGTPGEGDA